MIFIALLSASIVLASIIIIVDFKLNEDEFPEVTKHRNFTKAMEKK